MSEVAQYTVMAAVVACLMAGASLTVWVQEHRSGRVADGHGDVELPVRLSGLGRWARATFLTIGVDTFLLVGTAYIFSIDSGVWGISALTALVGTPVVALGMCVSSESRPGGLGVFAGYLVSVLSFALLLMAFSASLE